MAPLPDIQLEGTPEGEKEEVLVPAAAPLAECSEEVEALREVLQVARETIANARDLLANAWPNTPLPACAPEEVQLPAGRGHLLGGGSSEEVARGALSAAQSLYLALGDRLLHPLLAMSGFRAGDIALFMPADPQRRIWMAFNSNAPHYFLPPDILAVFLRRSARRPSIIARLLCVTRRVAGQGEGEGEGEGGAEGAYFGLQDGTEYFLCDAEPLYKSKGNGNSSKNSSKQGHPMQQQQMQQQEVVS